MGRMNGVRNPGKFLVIEGVKYVGDYFDIWCCVFFLESCPFIGRMIGWGWVGALSLSLPWLFRVVVN